MRLDARREAERREAREARSEVKRSAPAPGSVPSASRGSPELQGEELRSKRGGPSRRGGPGPRSEDLLSRLPALSLRASQLSKTETALASAPGRSPLAPPRTAKARSTRARRAGDSSCRRHDGWHGRSDSDIACRPYGVPMEELQEHGSWSLPLVSAHASKMETWHPTALNPNAAHLLRTSSASRKLSPAFRQAWRNSYLRCQAQG